jgi:hypothetical protein
MIGVRWSDRLPCAPNSGMPSNANTICASACMVVLTVMAAAASRIRAPRCDR